LLTPQAREGITWTLGLLEALLPAQSGRYSLQYEKTRSELVREEETVTEKEK
jgi:hypothetical protein